MKKIILVLLVCISISTMSFSVVEKEQKQSVFFKIISWEETFWTYNEAFQAKINKIIWCENHYYHVISSGVEENVIPPFPSIWTAKVKYDENVD